MNATPPAADLRHLARRRVRRQLGWLVHLLVFVLVNAGLWAGGASDGVWPLAGWGLGLAIHGLVVGLRLAGEGWVRRLVDAETSRLQQRG
ncbi:2TM domain-containing protein [Caldimonas thermodepolymerans]|uniref:2TM domain-containing protein n=1 Tax=Caldimonas thermodepolymerans TaxID=215580 RepID=UPI0022361291|nr:2TM domain-containing protein [Caldimonas thermodepolymerans]UZG43265.1 2TM domain-containing protein [Caldimonas thermodepolymerans]